MINGAFEGWRLYETVAQSGVPYPTAPANPTFEQDIFDAPTVWHVKELVNPEFDDSAASPNITSEDAGKNHLMFCMGNGPVLGGYSGEPGLPNAGSTTAYLPEGTRLAGVWYNGQLYGVPLTVDDASSYTIPS